jgi:hypothetical protein
MGEPLRSRVLLAGTALAVLLPGGCSDGPSSTNLRDGAASVSASPVAIRTDREPIERRFPALGDFTEVHWVGWPLSDPEGLGPTDVALQALVVLAEPELAAAREAYEWDAAPADFDARLRDELRPHLPVAGDWRHSDEYESTATTAQYWGSVYLDVASGTVYLDVSTH